jgi:hypothetical protein
MAQSLFVQSCSAAAQYPKNLLNSRLLDHDKQIYNEHLKEREGGLFVSSDYKPGVSIIYFHERTHGKDSGER